MTLSPCEDCFGDVWVKMAIQRHWLILNNTRHRRGLALVWNFQTFLQCSVPKGSPFLTALGVYRSFLPPLSGISCFPFCVGNTRAWKLFTDKVVSRAAMNYYWLGSGAKPSSSTCKLVSGVQGGRRCPLSLSRDDFILGRIWQVVWK